MTAVPSLPGHALFLVLLQISAILVVSRILAEAMKRLGQPAVIGELLAGIVIGPSVLGWLWPGAFAAGGLFPPEASQVHLLEVVAWLGMILLLLLTGLETDVRLLRHLGRSALTSSALGMAVPFFAGLVLGLFTPERFLANPDRRLLFSVFLATAMSISAMPVIAKILMDLELTKRNIGVVILSAGVVDDTTGWLILSLIAGIAAAKEYVVLRFGVTLALTAVFLSACRFVVYPAARWIFRVIDERARAPNPDLALMVVFAFVLSAITEKIGIHAVFGAFMAGCILRQVPHLRPATQHRLESVTLSVFAPIFFGVVGLKVDLRSLGSPAMLLVVLGVATLGKLVGCTWGGLLGKMSFWESFSIGVAMNARGAMELVVALIGLNLGILNPAMYAIIVVMAVVTSFMAPIGLRLTMPRVRMSPAERARIAAEAQHGLLDKARLKALVPTAGGPNALIAARIGARLVRSEAAGMTVLYVQSSKISLLRRLRNRIRPDLAGRNLQEHLEQIRTFATGVSARVDIRKVTEPDAAAFVCKEAAHGYQLLLLGAGHHRYPLRSALTTAVLAEAPCHVGIVHGRGAPDEYRRILVPTDGSFFSRAALELAVLYAEEVEGQVTVLHSVDAEDGSNPIEVANGLEEGFRRMIATTVLTTLSPLLTRTSAKVQVIVRESDQPTLPVLAEAKTGRYGLLVVGAENHAVQHRLSIGYDVERLVDEVPCTVLVVVPKIAKGVA